MLRVGVGLHFYLEGSTKLRDDKPFTGPFFANATGPLAPMFRNMVWDIDGRWRLDGGSTLKYWQDYQQRIASHFRFDEKQAKAAKNTYVDYEKRLKWYFGHNKEELDEYLNHLDRRDRNRSNPARRGLASMQAHDARIEAERNQKKGPLLAGIDKMWADYENDLNAIATQEQWTRHGRLPVGKIGRQPLDSEFMDAVVPYFDLIIGLLLILGLFTRVAGIAGALFLAGVCASQWPGYGGAPIYNQFVEMLALLTLAAIGAGQFYGLDYVITGLRHMSRRKDQPAMRTTTTTTTNQPASVLVPVKGAKA